MCKHKKNTILSWSIFIEELIAYHDDVKSNSSFIQLINLRKKGLVLKHIQQFQKMSLRVEGIPNDKLLDLFIGTLKDNIQHEGCLFVPTSLEKAFMVARKVESQNLVMATRRTTPNTSRESNVLFANPTQCTRLTPQQLEERRAKGLFFNCDSKYSKGHKCAKKKLFYRDCEEEETNEQEPSQVEESEETTSKEITPTISCHALARIFTPQTLKIEGYIKRIKVTLLIDSSSTHHFIHYKLAKALNCFIYLTPEFRLMIADGGTINCLGKCHNITLTMGEYVLNSPMISIPMGGVDVVLRV